MTVLLIIFGALMLIGLVIVHELGHFYAARKSGVDVEEFGIGFPPKAKSLGKKNGTEYTLNWLPLGGFVKLKGEHDSDTSKGSFGAASLSNKVRIMVAGVVVNAVVAVIMMSIVAAVALPQVFGERQFWVKSDTQLVRHDVVLAAIVPGSPAEKAGLAQEDILLSIRDAACAQNDEECKLHTVSQASDLKQITPLFAGREVAVSYVDADDKQTKELKTTLLTDEQIAESKRLSEECLASGTKEKDCPYEQSYLGILPDDYIEKRATWSAPIVGVVFSGQVIWETFAQFGAVFADLFRGSTEAAERNLTGVLGIGYILGQIADRGFIAVLFLTAVISLSLALMNILPIPALDGGRLFVTLVFRFFKKPLTKEVEERIHGSGFAFLMLLFVLITVLDVRRIFID